MQEQILSNLDNPGLLEKLYRDNKAVFKSAFNGLYPGIKEKMTAQIWNERLNFEKEEISWISSKELGFVIVTSILAGLIAKIPQLALLREDYFYSRNIAFIVFPFLAAWFAWKQQLSPSRILMVGSIFLVSAVYINFLQYNETSDTVMLACIHLPLFLWSVLGYVFSGGEYFNLKRRLEFLQYNGNLVVMAALMVIAGFILSAITIGLFRLIGLNIEEFYGQYIIVFGASALPIVATALVQTNPQLVNKVSPIIARIFTPLVLVMLVAYLIAVIYTGKDPYNDREFLMIFNLLLIGVMALILFSVTGTATQASRMETMLLLALSAVTIVVNGIALSAILFRISEWGITPNRLAVLGGNILILTNLLLVTNRLFRAIRNPEETLKVEFSIAAFLPVYVVWTLIVIFAFPVFFNFA